MNCQVVMPVAPGGEVAHQAPAPEVVGDEQRNQRDLGVQPAGRRLEPAEPQPHPEHDGEHRAGRHDSPEQLALHQLEALERHAVLRLRVIDEQPRQIEQPGEPGHHEDEVQRLDPEHSQDENRLRAKRMASA